MGEAETTEAPIVGTQRVVLRLPGERSWLRPVSAPSLLPSFRTLLYLPPNTTS
jgi:hypothetical protein